MAILTASNKRKPVVQAPMMLGASAYGMDKFYSRYSITLASDDGNGKTIYHKLTMTLDEARKFVDYFNDVSNKPID